MGLKPEEVAHLRARAEMMIALKKRIRKNGWTQVAAAEHLGVTQPRISEQTHGKFNRFGLDHLVTLLARAGLSVDIRIKKSAPTPQAA